MKNAYGEIEFEGYYKEIIHNLSYILVLTHEIRICHILSQMIQNRKKKDESL
jgi:hypothetical protein